MARQVKPLYKFKSLDDLKSQADCKNLPNTSAKLIITTADKLFSEAEKYDSVGDEELAFYYYFRYADAITLAKKKDDYRREKDFYDKLISKQKFLKAIEKVDNLQNSLKKRYGILKDIEESESKAKQKEYNDAVVNKISQEKTSAKPEKNGKPPLSAGNKVKTSISNLNGIVKENGVGVDKPGVKNAGITPQELKTMLDQKAKRILFVDCRDKADFTNNHVNHSNCISIPATSLFKGMSAHMIQVGLKDQSPESYMEWRNRGSFDYIILYDWNSSFDHRLQSLDIVYDALVKWDPDTMKTTNVLVVQGGMKSIYYTYPNLLTNPQSAVSNNSKLNGNGSTDLTTTTKLDSISYPDLDDNVSKPKPPKPMTAPQEAREPNASNTAAAAARFSSANSAINHLPQPPSTNAINTNDGHTVPKNVGSGMVAVDRSTKPSRLPSASRIPNGPAGVDKFTPVPGEVADSEENHASLEKTEVKVNEYSQALDAVIESSKEAVRVDTEVNQLRDMLSKQQHDVDLRQKLKAKETENEALKRILESRNDEVAKLKSHYEAALREQKAKHTLPQIRKPVEEEAIAAKQIEKERLDEIVRELRKVKLPRDTEARKDESVAKTNEPRNAADSVAKLPPIPSNNPNSFQRVNSGTGTTQLPAINNTNQPDPGPAHAPSFNKPSSTVVPSASRPVSQDTPGITRQKLKDENSEPPRSSALKRSHSHPNIAQSHDDDLSDDLPSGSQVPRINRGLKPSGQRTNVPEVHTTPRRFARNFEVVSSTEKSKTGLKNLGNTCYMNSIIQCLSHTNKLVDYLRNEEYLKDWHPQRSSTRGEATEELAAAVKQMHSGHRSIALRDLKNMIGKFHSSFKGFDQQDSHEFITILLDWLHEELNRVEKVPLKEQKNDGLTDEVAAERTWEDFKRSNNSKISELFCGQQKSCVTCASCSRQSVTFEPFFILSVPIPNSGKKCDIQQCMDFYTTEEQLSDWNCVHCKKKVRATKKIDLWRLPPYLIIHFQRFYFDGYWKKRLTEIDFPVDSLKLNHKVLGRDCNNFIEKCPSYDYQLYGVSNHYGTMDSGHYTAYCRMPGIGNWWKFDDHEVCPINSRDVPTAAAYILFYQNRNYR